MSVLLISGTASIDPALLIQLLYTLAGVGSMAKLYFDGASRGNPGESASACVLISETHTSVTHAKYIGSDKTNNYAEYTALIIGLELALNAKHKKLHVFGDSLLVINQITGKWRTRHPNITPLWKQAMKLLAQFDQVSASFIPRSQNKTADHAANEAIDSHLKNTTPRVKPRVWLDVGAIVEQEETRLRMEECTIIEHAHHAG